MQNNNVLRKRAGNLRIVTYVKWIVQPYLPPSGPSRRFCTNSKVIRVLSSRRMAFWYSSFLSSITTWLHCIDIDIDIDIDILLHALDTRHSTDRCGTGTHAHWAHTLPHAKQWTEWLFTDAPTHLSSSSGRPYSDGFDRAWHYCCLPLWCFSSFLLSQL